jgi:hypothetical protein
MRVMHRSAPAVKVDHIVATVPTPRSARMSDQWPVSVQFAPRFRASA